MIAGRRNGPCGGVPGIWPTSSHASWTLDATGAGTATITTHNGCGNDFIDTPVPISVLSLNADGSGTIEISGSQFSVQVSPDREVFNVVQLTAAGRFFAGVGIRRSTAGHISKPNLAGPWQGTIFSSDNSNLNVENILATFKLNAKALTKNLTVTLHGTEGDATIAGITLTILTLNPDGSGTATTSFEGETEPESRIQVSPDRSIIGVVDVNPDSNEFSVGVLIAQ
jgi:hypothetical protein